MRSTLWIALLALAACNGGDSTTDDSGPTDDGPPTFDDFIYTTVEATGDHGCYDFSGTWLTQDVDTTQVGTGALDGTVADFETEDPVPDAEVFIWYSDSTDGAADVETTSDNNGEFTATVPVCAPFTYKTQKPSASQPPKETFEAHQLYGPPQTGNITDDFNSVSSVTYQIIPNLLGVSVDEDKGIIAGTAFDCTNTEIEGAQVVVRDADGNIPEDLVVKYFVDNFPNRDQEWTSADGLWVAVNVPEGTLTVELWGRIDGELQQLGATNVPSRADVINISNIYEGYGDGVKYPDSCLTQTN